MTFDPRNPPVMTCGHYANATTPLGFPACAICGGTEVDTTPQPERTEWTCGSCHKVSPKMVAFGDAKTGFHYCGCMGWN